MIRAAIVWANQVAYSLHPTALLRAARRGYRALERSMHRHRFGRMYVGPCRPGPNGRSELAVFRQCSTAWCQQQQRLVEPDDWVDDDFGRPGL